jgi:hypothetical protein
MHLFRSSLSIPVILRKAILPHSDASIFVDMSLYVRGFDWHAKSYNGTLTAVIPGTPLSLLLAGWRIVRMDPSTSIISMVGGAAIVSKSLKSGSVNVSLSVSVGDEKSKV